MRMTRLAALVATAVVLATTLSGCGSLSGGHGLTLYNGQHEQTTDALVAAFERSTGITVNVRSGDEDTFADEIVTEGSHSPADIVYTENSPALEYLQGKGLLAPVDPTTLAETPSRYNSPIGDWVGVSARVSVIVYNPSLIAKSALPTTVLGLANPRYKGKLAFAAGETDFQPIVTSVARAYGQIRALAWLQALKANAAGHIYPDNETITNDVNRGTVAFGVINQYYWYRLRAQLGSSGMHSLITSFAPHDPGYVIDVSGAAILKSSTHQAEAQKFLAFLVSPRGEEIIAHSLSFEYPLGSHVTTAQDETPFAKLQPNSVSVAELGDGQLAITLLRRAGLL